MRIENLEKATETAQGKAFFEWLRLFSRMAAGGMIQAYEGEYGSERYVLDATSSCSSTVGLLRHDSRIAEAAWKEYKRDPRAAERVVTQHEEAATTRCTASAWMASMARSIPATAITWSSETLLTRAFSTGGNSPATTISNATAAIAIGAGPSSNRRRRMGTSQPAAPGFFATEKSWRAAGAPREWVFGNSHYQWGRASTTWTSPFGAEPSSNASGITRRGSSTSPRRSYAPRVPVSRVRPVYRVTETSHGGNWPKHDPNHSRAEPYLVTVPRGEGYPEELAGGRTIGQAWGRIRYAPGLANGEVLDAIEGTSTLVHSQTPPYLRPCHAGSRR